MKKEWVWDKRRWKRNEYGIREDEKKTIWWMWKAYQGLTRSQKFECLGLKFTDFLWFELKIIFWLISLSMLQSFKFRARYKISKQRI